MCRRLVTDFQCVLQKHKNLQNIIATLNTEELSGEDRLAVARARRLQRFYCSHVLWPSYLPAYLVKMLKLNK